MRLYYLPKKNQIFSLKHELYPRMFEKRKRKNCSLDRIIIEFFLVFECRTEFENSYYIKKKIGLSVIYSG